MRVPGGTPQIDLRRFFKRFRTTLVMRGLGQYNCTRRRGLPCNETEVDAVFD
jgi:hypothetical protein